MTTAADMIATAPSRLDLDSHYPLTPDQIRHFRHQGFVKLKHVLSPETLAHYGREISAKVQELNTMRLPMEQRTTKRPSCKS